MDVKNILFGFLLVSMFYSCNTVQPGDIPVTAEKNINNIIITKFKVYDKANDGLPDNEIFTTAVDKLNNIWAGTFYDGISKFDGIKWTNYNTKNSGLPNDSIWCIFPDSKNNIWIGTVNGLAKFDGTSWVVYTPKNSPLPYKLITYVNEDKNNILWIGCGHATGGGLVSFDGTNWIVYTPYNSLLPSSIINSIYIDKENDKWIGTGIFQDNGGLVKIDKNNNWFVYNDKNTKLIYNQVLNVAGGQNGDIWIGTNVWYLLSKDVYDGALQKFENGDFIDFSPNPGKKFSDSAITSNRIDELIYDENGFHWVATAADWKFMKYNLSLFQNGKWRNVSDMVNGYPSTVFIQDIKIASNNKIILATQLGIIELQYSFN